MKMNEMVSISILYRVIISLEMDLIIKKYAKNRNQLTTTTAMT